MPRMNATPGSSGTSSGETYMKVYFDVSSETADIMLEKLDRMLSPGMLAVFLGGPVVDHFQDKFNRFFDMQGTDRGAWAPLSEVTILDREEQGFGPGPINQRTGELRDYVTQSPGEIKALTGLAVLTYPGKTPGGELGNKVKIAQQGGFFQGNSVPARHVIDSDETDLLYMMSALNFFLTAGV